MKTVVVQIENNDRLTQVSWVGLIRDVIDLMSSIGNITFSGGNTVLSSKQRYCVVATMSSMDDLEHQLKVITEDYLYIVSLTIGDTKTVG